MWGMNCRRPPKRTALSLEEERRLIAKAKKGHKAETEELDILIETQEAF